MRIRTFAATLIVATSVVGTGIASAQVGGPKNAEFYSVAEIMGMKMMDKNKDGMVSKKEYLNMMSMAWDMNAKKMGVKGDMMTDAQFKEILMYLKAGG